MKFKTSKALDITLGGGGGSEKKANADPKLWRDLTAFWILGLCNNYGYVVMLSAAHDILATLENNHNNEDKVPDPTERICNKISTGAILLADIVPALLAKFVCPFIPLWQNARVAVCCLLASAGFILVAFAETEWVAVLGVIATSFSSGIGEATFLSYSAKFNKNVISTWSSGTGGAGIAGSLSYAFLIQIGLSPVVTLLVMLVVPALEAVAFWGILRKPQENLPRDSTTTNNSTTSSNDVSKVESNLQNGDSEEDTLVGFKNKLRLVPQLMVFVIPLTTVYLFEYFINQGLFELIHFSDIWLNHSSQYRWLQVDYQIGVFISRSSVNIVQIDKVWIMSVLQFVNVIYFIFEVLYFFTPNIWIIFAIVFWEGLLGGGAYVNTFYRISKDVYPESKRQFVMGATAISDSVGIALAGMFAIPTHNAICGLPVPIR